MPPQGMHALMSHMTYSKRDTKNLVYSIMPDLVWLYTDFDEHVCHSRRTIRQVQRFVGENPSDGSRYIPLYIKHHIVADRLCDSRHGVLTAYAQEMLQLARNSGLFKRTGLFFNEKKQFSFAQLLDDLAMDQAIFERYGTSHLDALNYSARHIDRSYAYRLLTNSFIPRSHKKRRILSEKTSSLIEEISKTDFHFLTDTESILATVKKKVNHNKKRAMNSFASRFFIPLLEEKKPILEGIIKEQKEMYLGRIDDLLRLIYDRTNSFMSEVPDHTIGELFG